MGKRNKAKGDTGSKKDESDEGKDMEIRNQKPRIRKRMRMKQRGMDDGNED